MINVISIAKNVSDDENYITLPFYKNNTPLEKNNPVWGMSLRRALSMRFTWSEVNPNRIDFFKKLAPTKKIVPLELCHSKIVYNVEDGNETQGKTGDGIITKNEFLLPVVTVADCVPIYFYDNTNGVFGIVHSGWKGTGIIENAISLACEKYNSEPKNISVAIGAHICSSCYIVNDERAKYFENNFGKDCIRHANDLDKNKITSSWNTQGGKLYHLSLTNANLSVLKKVGVLEENIVIANDCTCCNSLFGSYRRETTLAKTNSEKPLASALAGTPKVAFTVQAAFVGFIK